jgi:hypothetical protein
MMSSLLFALAHPSVRDLRMLLREIAERAP